MSNELTDVRCPCGAEFQADSYDAGFIAGSGMCQNCDAALPPKDICTCPSGNGSLRHPCPAHPAVEQAGGDERDFQAEGAQEVPSPVSQEYDRHLISLLRKGEALPGHQEEAADEIERLRDWNDHLNNTVLPNILNPTFLMLMKGGERLLDLCTKDGEFIGVSLNDMKDVFDWMVTHARIAPDQAALAQPSGEVVVTKNESGAIVSVTRQDKEGRVLSVIAESATLTAQAEKAEVERPEVVAWQYRVTAGPQTGWSLWHPGKGEEFERSYTVERRPLMTVAQHERIVGELRADRDSWAEQAEQRLADWDEMRKERDAALAEVERLRQFERICEGLPQDAIDGGWTVQGIRGYAKHLEDQLKVALARVAELETALTPFAAVADVYDDSGDDDHEPYTDIGCDDRLCLTLGQHRAARTALSGAPSQALHSVPEAFDLLRQALKLMPLGTKKRAEWVGRTSDLLCIAQAQHSVPEVSGIGRDFAYPRSVVLYLRTEPTDDDLRAIHDGLRSLAAAPGKEVGHE
ncbi:hypothetical protein [Pseudomonas aeruginosa]|uniref:hypothetical protein n=1 Tax=Pseudomonas aeruginosa TaxID=287 RepID=UPI000AA06111|nr:hypothetical protein [Pseudomonas aeruginosa]